MPKSFSHLKIFTCFQIYQANCQVLDNIPGFKQAVLLGFLNFIGFFPSLDFLCPLFAGTPLGDLLGCDPCPEGYYEVGDNCYRIAGPQADQV